jgi:DNA polymerase-3 subunit gamma/tau
MHTARWTTAIAAAALAALPIAASAQSTQSAPQQNPPAQQSQPPSSTTAPQPPSSTAPQPNPAQPPAAAPAAGQVDVNAVKTHLSAARDTLAQLTSMPEAAKLQGTARTQVSELIADFNALISAQSDWRGAYNKVDSDLTAVIGPDASADNDQAVGTSGSTAAGTAAGTASAATGGTAGAVGTSGAASVDPAIRAKLVEFRSHLKEFEKAAGGSTPANAAGQPGGSMPPSLATSSTANPADPAAAASPASPAAGATPSAPASSVSPSSPTSAMSPADREHASADVNAAGNADAQKELDAISAILNASKTGTLTKAQTAQLKKHVEALRSLIGSR